MKKILPLIFCLALIINGIAQTNLPKTIAKDQKIYELSMVWKEVSYNFDNFDNCSELDVDSLYRSYISIIQDTECDWDYSQAMRRFMAHFNNAHTSVYGWPTSKTDTLFTMICIKTNYRNGKIFIENIATRYAEQLQPGDEIITINDIPALNYFEQKCVPYIFASNEDDKIHFAMFDIPTEFHIYPDNTKFTFGVATTEGIKKVELTSDRKFSENRWLVRDYTINSQNLFLLDSIQKTAYFQLTDCSLATSQYFQSYNSEINQCNTIILDLSRNGGGQSTYNDSIYNYLIQKDSIESYLRTSRLHEPVRKGQGRDYCNESIQNDETNDYWCSRYKGTFFGDPLPMNFSGKMAIDTTTNFKGKVYVIIGRETASAAEDLVTMLSQDDKITFLGGRTNGSTGRPYRFSLPSGMQVSVNTLKTFDFQGNDISAGFTPNYEVDFYDCYKTTEPQQLIDCLMDRINDALKKP